MKFIKSTLMTLIVALAVCFIPSLKSEAAYPNINKIIQTGMTTDSISISWTATDCTSYDIEIKEYLGKEYTKVGSTTETSYTISSLLGGQEYDIKITGNNPETSYPDTRYFYDAKTKVVAPKVKQDKWYHYIKTADISWDEQRAADGYEVIWYKPNGKVAKKESKNGYTNSDSLNNVANSNVYSVKVRAIQKFGDSEYKSDWTEIKVFEQSFINTKKTRMTTKGGKKALSLNWTK